MSRKLRILGFGFAADLMTFARSFPPSPAFPSVTQDKQCAHSVPRAPTAGRGGDEHPKRFGKLNTLRQGEAGPPPPSSSERRAGPGRGPPFQGASPSRRLGAPAPRAALSPSPSLWFPPRGPRRREGVASTFSASCPL